MKKITDNSQKTNEPQEPIARIDLVKDIYLEFRNGSALFDLEGVQLDRITKEIISFVEMIIWNILGSEPRRDIGLFANTAKHGTLSFLYFPGDGENPDKATIEKIKYFLYTFHTLICTEKTGDLLSQSQTVNDNNISADEKLFIAELATRFLDKFGGKKIKRHIAIECGKTCMHVRNQFSMRTAPKTSISPRTISGLSLSSTDYDKQEVTLRHSESKEVYVVKVLNSDLLDDLHSARQNNSDVEITVKETISTRNELHLELIGVRLASRVTPQCRPTHIGMSQMSMQ